jgi:3-dehydroquinate synthase
MRSIGVEVPGAAYDVRVGAGALDVVPELLAGRRRVAVVTQGAVRDALGDQVVRLPWPVIVMGDGEQAKSLATVEELCRAFSAEGLLRGDAVVALGGGVVGDTAGFAAAVYYRGIAVVQAPTTLLAQVDAAIGGKTAVNLPEGKNLVGAFHQPVAVACDTTTLATLGPREFRAGLGEVAKYALMPQGGGVAAVIRDHAREIVAREPEVLAALVAECVAIKAAVVSADPEERTGIRATLNYGHTLAHALETTGAYELHHGEAVAVGLVFADALALATERLDAATVDEHRALLAALDLPTCVPEGARASDLLAVMARDKKAKGGLTFVLPGADGLGTVDDPPTRALAAAFRAVGVDADMER